MGNIWSYRSRLLSFPVLCLTNLTHLNPESFACLLPCHLQGIWIYRKHFGICWVFWPGDTPHLVIIWIVNVLLLCPVPSHTHCNTSHDYPISPHSPSGQLLFLGYKTKQSRERGRHLQSPTKLTLAGENCSRTSDGSAQKEKLKSHYLWLSSMLTSSSTDNPSLWQWNNVF